MLKSHFAANPMAYENMAYENNDPTPDLTAEDGSTADSAAQSNVRHPVGLLYSNRFWSFVGAVLFVLAVSIWCNPFVGGEWKHVVESGPVNFRPDFGINYGSGSVFARAGQTIKVDCQAEIKAGSLSVWIRRDPWIPTIRVQDALRSVEIDRSQTMTIEAVAPETGFYKIARSTWRKDNELDIQYELNWYVK
jgi:hypothetical protein